MEIDITDFFNNCDPKAFSASAWELGDDAGKITWEAALAAVDHQMEAYEELLTTQEQVAAYRQSLIEGGAEREEVMQHTARELNALLLQEICANMREGGLDQRPLNWAEYERGAQAGRHSGRIGSSFV